MLYHSYTRLKLCKCPVILGDLSTVHLTEAKFVTKSISSHINKFANKFKIIPIPGFVDMCIKLIAIRRHFLIRK